MNVPGAILWVSLALAILGALRRVAAWRRGRHAPVDWRGVAALPRRYLRDVHRVVSRDASTARMHAAAAGGFVATCALAFPVLGAGFDRAAAPWGLLAASAVLAGGGVLALVRRRGPDRPRRLSGGPYERIAFAIIAFALFIHISTLKVVRLVEFDWTSPFGLATACLGAFGAGQLIAGMTGGPMRHAFAGALHLAFHPRPERFSNDKSAASLKAIDLNSDPLGVASPEHFEWNRLLSLDACVQCGRCEEVCPAFAAGAPLNPKKLIFDLWAASLGPGDDGSYAGAPVHGSLGPRRSRGDSLVGVDTMIDPDTIWACTTCRACVDACPMMIEVVDVVVDLRRYATMEAGATPGSGAEALERLRQTDANCGKPLMRKFDWAAALDLPLAQQGRRFDALLWLGDGAFDLRGQRTIAALVRLLRRGGVDFAVLGEREADVGDVARRLGEEAEFQRLALKNIETLRRLDFERVVTIDPHVLHALSNEYPQFGGTYSVEHGASAVLALIESGRLTIKPLELGTVTYHDPCYLGRYNGEYDAPRKLLAAAGARLVEMSKTRQTSFCCGWGGGAALTDVPTKNRIPDLRLAQAAQTGAETIAVACPNCAVMFEGASQHPLTVVDVIELVERAAAAADAP